MADEGCTVVFSKGVGNVLKGKVRIQAERDVATFRRKGGLYLADVELSCLPESSFPRQGTK